MEEIDCVNYELCETMIPEDSDGYCMACGSGCSMGHGWDKLTFIDTNDENKECAVCFKNYKRKLVFPTNCGHDFCIPCSRLLLFGESYPGESQSKTHLCPVPFGCPPCPNGCDNPTRGIQCYCEEYDTVQNLWLENHPEQWKQWNDAEEISLFQNDENSVYGKATCPLCRAKYVRTKHNYTVISTYISEDLISG